MLPPFERTLSIYLLPTSGLKIPFFLNSSKKSDEIT